MGVRYRLQPNDNGRTIGNLDHNCISCAQVCSVSSEIVKCQATGKHRRRGLTDIPLGKLYLCTDEAIKSSRLFREKIRAFSESIPLVARAREEATREVARAQEEATREVARAQEEATREVARAREEATREVSDDVHRLIHNLITLNAELSKPFTALYLKKILTKKTGRL